MPSLDKATPTPRDKAQLVESVFDELRDISNENILARRFGELMDFCDVSVSVRRELWRHLTQGRVSQARKDSASASLKSAALFGEFPGRAVVRGRVKPGSAFREI